MGHEKYGPADAHPPALLLGQKEVFHIVNQIYGSTIQKYI
jgi:hypothetical protein